MADRECSPLVMVPRWKRLSNRNPVYADRNRTKNMASFSVTEGKRAALFAGAANHLPSTPYNHHHAVLCNNSEFRVDRVQTA